MRGFAFLTLGAAAALLGIAGWSGSLPASPRTAAPSAAERSVTAGNHGPRIALTAAQQRQAMAAGGFDIPPQSLLRVDRQMRYGDFLWDDAGVPAGPITVRVDLRTQILSVFRAGHEIGTAVVLYGADSKQTPTGRFPILWKRRDHRSSLYDAPMPYTLRLTGDGIAIHGSNVRWGAATHGCVGVPTGFARYLFDAASVGDRVTIVRTASLT